MSFSPFTILYVNHPTASAQWYAQRLGQPALEASPTFAMFALGAGAMLGLWQREQVQPTATAQPGGQELALAVQGRSAVDELYERWHGMGSEVLQRPTVMDFGYTFTVQDPDGHRLRVFAPEAR